MKTPRFLLAVALAVVLGGCERGETIPQDRFKLSIEEVITGEYMAVSVLRIQVPVKASVSVDTEDSHNHVTTADPPVDGPREGEVLLAAVRVAPGKSEEAYIQVLTRARAAGSDAGGPAVFPVPVGTALGDFFKITAADGNFALDSPLKIAELRGKPVTLTVGKPTR